MNAEELMIGNFVMIESKLYTEANGIPLKISRIEKKQHPKITDEHYAIGVETLDEMDSYGCWSNSLRPIPITKDWLEKLGFEYSLRHGFYIIPKFGNNSRIDFAKGSSGLQIRPCKFGGGINDYYEFIHELQNHFQVNHKIKLEIK